MLRSKLTKKTEIPCGVILEFGDGDAEAYIDLNPPDPALPQPSIAADGCATGPLCEISGHSAEEAK